MRVSKSHNHNLFVMAELFTNSLETDAHFAKRVGINSYVREALNIHSSTDISSTIHYFS